MSRCLSMISTAVVSIVCMCIAGGCAAQGNEPDDPPAGDPAAQDLTAPQLFQFFPPLTTDQFGNIHLTGVLDITDNKEVDLDFESLSTNMTAMRIIVQMGNFATVNATVGNFPLTSDSIIHTFNVMGPQVNVSIFGGPPNTAVNIEGWVFVH
jgi:hypothetical protein